MGLEGNLCRCTGYHNIVKAVLAARRQRRDGAVTVVDVDDAPPSSARRCCRKEDPPLLTGEARFTDDLVIPGALHLAVAAQPVRPRPHHARSTSRGALAMPGVVAVLHRRRPARRRGPAPMPCAWPVTEDMKNPPHYPLAVDKVRYVGDGVAVVARRRATPRPATRSTRSIVDYEPLPAVIDLEDALTDRVARPRRARHQQVATRGSSSSSDDGRRRRRSPPPPTPSRSATSSSA